MRDLLHPLDLFELINRQRRVIQGHRATVFAVGGGLRGSVSLAEYTALAAEITGCRRDIGSDPATANVDVPWFVTDASRARSAFEWEPKRTPRDIATDIHNWLLGSENVQLKELFTKGLI